MPKPQRKSESTSLNIEPYRNRNLLEATKDITIYRMRQKWKAHFTHRRFLCTCSCYIIMYICYIYIS